MPDLDLHASLPEPTQEQWHTRREPLRSARTARHQDPDRLACSGCLTRSSIGDGQRLHDGRSGQQRPIGWKGARGFGKGEVGAFCDAFQEPVGETRLHVRLDEGGRQAQGSRGEQDAARRVTTGTDDQACAPVPKHSSRAREARSHARDRRNPAGQPGAHERRGRHKFQLVAGRRHQLRCGTAACGKEQDVHVAEHLPVGLGDGQRRVHMAGGVANDHREASSHQVNGVVAYHADAVPPPTRNPVLRCLSEPGARVRMRTAVVVLGDLGRSPRMCYHAQALSAHGVDVDLVGYLESDLPEALRQDPRIAVHAVRDAPHESGAAVSRARYLAAAALRGVRLLVRLTSLLAWRLDRPDVIFVQNPPGVPALLVAWVASRLRRARFAIDWHNLTHSMLALRFGPSHWLVRLVKRHERWMGRRADASMFVSSAMQTALASEWGLRGIVFRDRPAASFEPISAEERERVRRNLCTRLNLKVAAAGYALAVSPTSWTSDEDFDLLVDAVVRCDARIGGQEMPASSFPELVILVTGRGPLRESFERRFATLELARIQIRTVWLEPGEYPRVLAAADLGISLHRSASGIDLPMKIADMFGAGIPVCALEYGPCLSELVRHGDNGLLFSTADELADQLLELFTGFPAGTETLLKLTAGARARRGESWQAAWESEVWPLWQSLSGR